MCVTRVCVCVCVCVCVLACVHVCAHVTYVSVCMHVHDIIDNVVIIFINTLFLQRIGYLAATQSFHEDTDVIMLTTNMIRKDLSSHHQYDAGLALDGLACFMTPDLARDLANDVLTLVSCNLPYVRGFWVSKPLGNKHI